MKNKIIDGHVHLHYNVEALDEEIWKGVNEFQKIMKRYNVKKIAGIFRPENLRVVRNLGNKTIYPGIYISDFDDLESLEKACEDFKFVKIHNRLASPDSDFSRDYLKKVIDKALKLGFKKFQIYTENITNSFMDSIKSYIEKGSLIFYLVHGINSLYGDSFSDRHPDDKIIKKIEELRKNVLLSSSPYSSILVYPNKAFQYAIKDGLENLISFDSDFTLSLVSLNPNFYRNCIKNITKSIGYNRKIFEENSEIFFG